MNKTESILRGYEVLTDIGLEKLSRQENMCDSVDIMNEEAMFYLDTNEVIFEIVDSITDKLTNREVFKFIKDFNILNYKN